MLVLLHNSIQESACWCFYEMDNCYLLARTRLVVQFMTLVSLLVLLSPNEMGYMKWTEKFAIYELFGGLDKNLDLIIFLLFFRSRVSSNAAI